MKQLAIKTVLVFVICASTFALEIVQPTFAVDNSWREGADINNDEIVDYKDFTKCLIWEMSE